MDHQSFVGAGQYVLPEEIDHGRVVGCLTDPSRLDEQCVGGGQLITGNDISSTVTAKWAKGSGGPSGSETGNLVVERERESRECPDSEHSERRRCAERASRPSDREAAGERGIGVNPGNEDIAGTLPSNAQGGQRTTDISGAYVVRERERAAGLPQVEEGTEHE